MSVIAKIANVLVGDAVTSIANTVKAYFPPSMSEEEKANLSIKLAEIESAKNLKVMQMLNEADKEFNKRIGDLEGTAKDLKDIPVLGKVIIFFRGSQRPVWGFFTLWADWQVWSHTWTINEQEQAMLMAVNILVLGFLFGERAVKNVMPFVTQFFGGRPKVRKVT